MTLVLELSPELETELREAAAARGIAVELVAVERIRNGRGEGLAPNIRRGLSALDDLLALGVRLTSGAAPLRDDAVARSYEGRS